jgi:hypothetical protein
MPQENAWKVAVEKLLQQQENRDGISFHVISPSQHSAEKGQQKYRERVPTFSFVPIYCC